jgi:TPP-dependent 2-oxoacid decarboxylase
VRAVRARYERKLAVMAADTEETMHPAALAKAIAEALPGDALAVFDGGHTTFWSNDFTPVHAVRTRFHEPGMSHLGFGLPYAIALQAQQPGRAVALITGDGSFGFTLNELDTARRHRLPVVNIIHNNAAWGIIRQGQKMQFDFNSAPGWRSGPMRRSRAAGWARPSPARRTSRRRWPAPWPPAAGGDRLPHQVRPIPPCRVQHEPPASMRLRAARRNPR